MVDWVTDCPSLAEVDKVDPLAGETAVFSYQTAVLGHVLESSNQGQCTVFDALLQICALDTRVNFIQSI